VAFSLPPALFGEGDEVSKLMRRYEQALDLARHPIQTLENRYREELEKLGQRFQEKGDLEGVLLVRDESEHFAVSKPRDFSTRPDLARLRSVYEESLVRIEAEIAETHSDIARQTIEHLRKLRARTAPGRLTASVIEEASEGGIMEGATDSLMQREWRRLGLPPPESGGSQWFQGDTPDEWHAWGFVFSPGMIVPAEDGSC